ncbi:MAG: hypothetical protein DBY23_02015 [Bacillota bacterium]|nr:MAG: hypothetical protein DBY23_02015 [Bacillota bacterium]
MEGMALFYKICVIKKSVIYCYLSLSSIRSVDMNINEKKDQNYYKLVEDILDNEEFQSLKNVAHHGLNRYDHCLRVSYYSYKITKLLSLSPDEVARAALLHDFFFENENTYSNRKERFNVLYSHPQFALDNAKKYFDLTKKQEDIILSHMFPICKTVPKYMESWIVDVVDDLVALYEKCYSVRYQFSAAATFLICLLVNFGK